MCELKIQREEKNESRWWLVKDGLERTGRRLIQPRDEDVVEYRPLLETHYELILTSLNPDPASERA